MKLRIDEEADALHLELVNVPVRLTACVLKRY